MSKAEKCLFLNIPQLEICLIRVKISDSSGYRSTSITPWTTAGQTTDEYIGFILSRGLAVRVGANNLTVGMGCRVGIT